MHRYGAITTEVECPTIRAEAGVIVIARTIRVVASVADWHHCTPGSSFFANDEKMLVRRLAGPAPLAAKYQEGLVGSNFRIDVLDAAITERKRLCVPVGAVLIE
jgi:hypothetical protein